VSGHLPQISLCLPQITTFGFVPDVATLRWPKLSPDLYNALSAAISSRL
jgi:hypothetical protein